MVKENNSNQTIDTGKEVYRSEEEKRQGYHANMGPLLLCKLSKPKTRAQISCEN
jgi:hypothetical protein